MHELYYKKLHNFDKYIRECNSTVVNICKHDISETEMDETIAKLDALIITIQSIFDEAYALIDHFIINRDKCIEYLCAALASSFCS